MIDQFPYSPTKKILLIEPPFYRFFNYERWYYPLTLTLIGTHLKKLGHDVRVYDADKPSINCRSLSRSDVRNHYHLYEEALENDKHPIWLEVYEAIEKFNPDVIGITSITAKIDSANIIARIGKKLFGNRVKIVLGGAHARGMRLIQPDYNFGEDYDEIVGHIPNLIDQKPDKNLIMGVEDYKPEFLSSMITVAGCPMNCTFCVRSYDRTFIYRNIPSIREEVEEIKDQFGCKQPIILADDCFLSHTRRFEEITAIFKEKGLKYIAGARIMALTPQRIETFISNGGICIHVGVESGSQPILDRMKKKLRVEEIIKRTKWLNEAGLDWQAFIMVGLPFESLDDLKLTEDLIHAIQPTFVSINRFTPYPGTEIYKEYFQDKQIRFKDLFQISKKSCVSLSKEMEDYIEHLYEVFDCYNSDRKAKINAQ